MAWRQEAPSGELDRLRAEVAALERQEVVRSIRVRECALPMSWDARRETPSTSACNTMLPPRRQHPRQM